MEKQYCKKHPDVVCILKTGTTAGKSGYGKTFYMCQRMCGFYQNAKIELSMKTCETHGGLVSIRRWIGDNCIQYKCQNKPHELGWCGTYAPAADRITNKENAQSKAKCSEQRPVDTGSTRQRVDKTGSRNPDKKGDGLLVNRSAQRSLQPKSSSHVITVQGLESALANHQKSASSSSSEVPVAGVGGKAEENMCDMSCEAISDVTDKLADMSFENEELARTNSRSERPASMKYPQQWCVDKTGSRNPDMKGAGLLVNRSAQRSLQPKPSSHAITGQGLESAPGNHQKSDSSEVPIAVADMSCEVISDVADMSFESKELTPDQRPQQQQPPMKTASLPPAHPQSHHPQSHPLKESLSLPPRHTQPGHLPRSLKQSPTHPLTTSEPGAVPPGPRSQPHPLTPPPSQLPPAIQPSAQPPGPSPPDHHSILPLAKEQPPGGPSHPCPHPQPSPPSGSVQSQEGARKNLKENSKEEKEEEIVGAETFKMGCQSKKVIQQINEIDSMLKNMAHKLPDGGANLRALREQLLARLRQMKKPVDIAAMQQRLQLSSAPASRPGFARILTNNVVEQLHRSIKDCPVHDEMMEDPAGLTVTLMAHQSKALAWMTWRESQVPSGGILADDMGLGKTLAMLSLVATGLDPPSDPGNKAWLQSPPAKPDLVKCAGNLVVCPKSLLMQWENEVKTKFESGTMKALIYHGPNRTKDPRVFQSYNVVITTYNIVGTEATTVLEELEKEGEKIHPSAKGPEGEKAKKKKTSSLTSLFGVHWRRVILDEAHVIRNPKTAVSVGCCLLTADSHWAVTGTPIQNKLQDMYSLVKFIQLAPFDDAMVWKSTVERRGNVGMRRLNTMVSALVLRRTKEEIGDRLHLTKRLVETHNICLRPEEDDVYKVLFQEARKIMYRWLEGQGEHYSRDKQGESDGASLSSLPPAVSVVVESILKRCVGGGSKAVSVLVLLLRLRQCCCHAYLLTSALKKEDSDLDSLSLELAMGALTLAQECDEVDHPTTTKPETSLPSVFKAEESSTKITEVINELKRISSTAESPPQKSVVVSQWTSMLNIVEIHLEEAGLSFSRIDGTVKPVDRQSRMNEFNSSKHDPMVMLLSLQAGGVGLNLIGGNHVFLLDLHWNPALEVQAADRCHRVGQPRDVHIHRFVCTGTVEERILQLQAKKLELAKNVLEGASTKMRKDRNKLSLNELKMLFDIV